MLGFSRIKGSRDGIRADSEPSYAGEAHVHGLSVGVLTRITSSQFGEFIFYSHVSGSRTCLGYSRAWFAAMLIMCAMFCLVRPLCSWHNREENKESTESNAKTKKYVSPLLRIPHMSCPMELHLFVREAHWPGCLYASRLIGSQQSIRLGISSRGDGSAGATGVVGAGGIREALRSGWRLRHWEGRRAPS